MYMYVECRVQISMSAHYVAYILILCLYVRSDCEQKKKNVLDFLGHAIKFQLILIHG